MKAFLFSSLALSLLSGVSAFSQNTGAAQPAAQAKAESAPPAVDEALRARVMKFYDAFIAGKFKEAYLLVADDSQDKFFELSKDEYKSCEILRINYSENFTKATVVTTCKSNWRWHGAVTLTTFPLTSTWEVVDGQWFWHFEKPTMVPSPFSPTGFVPVPKDNETSNQGLVPKDLNGAAKGILSQVKIDKSSVQLLSSQHSQAVLYLRNDMPGEVSATIDPINMPGLKVTLGQSKLEAHLQTTIVFEWTPDDPAIQCRDCALKTNTQKTVNVRIQPTDQVFPIAVVLRSSAESKSPMAPQAAAAPQK